MILSDSHIHTSFSSDSDEPMENTIKRAVELGLDNICFTEHLDYDWPENEDNFDFLLDIPAYVDAIELYREKYKDAIRIRRGLELGLELDSLERGREIVRSKSWKGNLDFVIGSVHLVDHYDPYYEEYWDSMGSEDEGIRFYYESILRLLSGDFDFDVMGHLDYIVRYTGSVKRMKRDENFDGAYFDKISHRYMDIVEEILKKIIGLGKGIEINSSGIRYGIKYPNPGPEYLKLYRELGGEIITVGSDAHRALDLAGDFDKVGEILKRAGFDYYCEFYDRKPVMKKIG